MIGVYTYVIRMLWGNVEDIHCINPSECSPLFRASSMLPELPISYLKLLGWLRAKGFNTLNPFALGHLRSFKYAMLSSGNGM